MKKTNSIILIDLENFVGSKDNLYFPYILNLLTNKFLVDRILTFGNFYQRENSNINNNKFINKDLLLNEIIKNEDNFNKSFLFFIKNILMLDKKAFFMNNGVSKNAADKNIINFLETEILAHKELYLETTIILFSQDNDFKEILNKLTQNNIFNLVIGSPNDNYKNWENLGQYRFDFNINKLLENKGKYLNDLYLLINEIKKTQNQQNCQHLTDLNDENKILYKLKVDLIKYKNKPRNLNALKNHIQNIMSIKKLNLSKKYLTLQERNELTNNIIEKCKNQNILIIEKEVIKYNNLL